MADQDYDIEDPKPKPKLPGMGGKPQLPGMEKKNQVGNGLLNGSNPSTSNGLSQFGKGHSDKWNKMQSDMAKRAAEAGLPNFNNGNDRLSDAIKRSEAAGYKFDHFTDNNDPTGDRTVTIDIENLTKALERRLSNAKNSEEKNAVSKELRYWQRELKDGMTAEQWKKQTGEDDPKLNSNGLSQDVNTNDLPSTSNLKIQATDARLGSGSEGSGEKIASAKTLGKAIALGAGKGVSGTLKTIGIAAKELDFFNEYTGKKAEELATYKAGKWIDEQVKDLVGDLSPEEQNNFSVKLASNMGQMGTLMLGGAGSKVLGMSEGLTAGFLGASMQGSAEYENAVNAGATPDQAAKAFWINTAIGSSQAIPVMGAFRKLDKYTGGLATGALAKELASTAGGRITGDMVQGAITNAAQMAGQTILTNVTAKNTYDATREVFDGLGESLGMGFIIGTALHGMTSAIREKRMAGNLTPEEDAQLAKSEDFLTEKVQEIEKKNQGEKHERSVATEAQSELPIADEQEIKVLSDNKKLDNEDIDTKINELDKDSGLYKVRKEKLEELRKEQDDYYDSRIKKLTENLPTDETTPIPKGSEPNQQGELQTEKKVEPIKPTTEAIKGTEEKEVRPLVVKDYEYNDKDKSGGSGLYVDIDTHKEMADMFEKTGRGKLDFFLGSAIHTKDKLKNRNGEFKELSNRQANAVYENILNNVDVAKGQNVGEFRASLNMLVSYLDTINSRQANEISEKLKPILKEAEAAESETRKKFWELYQYRADEKPIPKDLMDEWVNAEKKYKDFDLSSYRSDDITGKGQQDKLLIEGNKNASKFSEDVEAKKKEISQAYNPNVGKINELEKSSTPKPSTQGGLEGGVAEAKTEKINQGTEPSTERRNEDQSENQKPENKKEPQSEEIIPPGKPPIEEGDAVADEGGENKVGVSHAVLTDLSKRLNLKEPERGEYLSPSWYADRGRQLLAEGANPNEVDNPNNTLHDRISIARAHLENLVKASDEVARTNKEGIESDAYKEAWKQVNDYSEKVKGLGTDAHRAMTALQGSRDIDTDSFTAVRKATEEEIGKPLNEGQEKKIKELTTENEKLKNKTQDLEKKLVEATEKAVKESSEKQTPKEKAKSVADKIRQAKIHRPGMFSAATPASIVWDASVEVVAKTVEAGGKIADAIGKGIKYMQATDWYKKLNEADKKEAEKQFKDWHEDNGIDTKESEYDQKVKSGEVRSKMEKPLTDAEKIEADAKELEEIQKMFVNKKGNKFSIDEAKTIWDYAKKNYIDKGVKYRDMLINVANDLGLSWRQTSEALTSKKIKPISDNYWKKQSDYKKSQIATKNWVEAQGKSLPFKGLRKVSAAFRGVSVFGHGGIFIGTHAGMTLFSPSQWHVVIPAFIRGWKFAYGNEANYQRRVEQLRNDRNYVLAQRSGLKNNPDIVNTEEFQKSQAIFKKIGGEAGIKGFNAIKVLRQDLFNYHYDRLSAVEKADPEAVKQIARLVNNATGATNINLPKWVEEVSFAGGMEAARWGKWTRNPARATAIAVKALVKPESATVAEKVFAKVWARRVGEQIATMAGMLAINAAIQSVVDDKNKVNLSDPNKPDFLKFKFGDVTIDPTSGMRGAGMFAYGIGKVPFMSKKQLRGDTPMQAAGKQTFGYGRGKLAPFYSTVADFFDKKDFNRNPLPFSDEKPSPGHHKLTWGEYAWEKAPLPIAHAAQEMYHSALDNGDGKMKPNHIVDGIISGMLSGGTGLRVGQYNAEEADHSPFTDADKKDSTFKYFLDKGVELPNTALSSEEITDEKNKTKKKVSDYPKDIQEKYTEAHKQELKKELSEFKTKGFVYVKSYKDAKGETTNQVTKNKPKGESKIKRIDDLSIEELAQVLHIAQSQATVEAKKKVFKQ